VSQERVAESSIEFVCYWLQPVPGPLAVQTEGSCLEDYVSTIFRLRHLFTCYPSFEKYSFVVFTTVVQETNPIRSLTRHYRIKVALTDALCSMSTSLASLSLPRYPNLNELPTEILLEIMILISPFVRARTISRVNEDSTTSRSSYGRNVVPHVS
jgi:hypothetical protein